MRARVSHRPFTCNLQARSAPPLLGQVALRDGVGESQGCHLPERPRRPGNVPVSACSVCQTVDGLIWITAGLQQSKHRPHQPISPQQSLICEQNRQAALIWEALCRLAEAATEGGLTELPSYLCRGLRRAVLHNTGERTFQNYCPLLKVCRLVWGLSRLRAGAYPCAAVLCGVSFYQGGAGKRRRWALGLYSEDEQAGCCQPKPEAWHLGRRPYCPVYASLTTIKL